MTGTRDTLQDGSIQSMLRDSGLESAAELRSSLEELRALVPERAPAPRADLAALLATGAASAGAVRDAATTPPAGPSAVQSIGGSLPAGVTSLAAHRRRRVHRLALVGGAVVGAMTLGAGAVAASSADFREHVSQTVGSIFQPSGVTPDVAPQPARPSPADVPAPSLPAESGKADAGNATAPPSADEAAGGARSAAAVPAKPGADATPPAVGRGGVLPVPPHRPVAPTVPGLAGPGEGRALPKAPLPTLPAVPPALPARP